jgi:4-hydroxy-tetrahydrodipicolinate reductase
MKLPVVVVGAGPIGLGVARAVAARPGLELRAVVDTDPSKRGIAAGPVAVQADVPSDVEGGAGVALLCTSSRLAALAPQVEALVARGLHVVSTCEELVWPWRAQPELAKRIDAAAEASGVAVLGTGVNPGFLMDALPAFLTGVCHHVRSVRVERVQDASLRRRPFQDKVGVGLSVEAFRAASASPGGIGHVGLRESLDLLAAGLGRTITDAAFVLEPVLADRPIERLGRRLEKGDVIGVEQRGEAQTAEGTTLSLFFRAAFGQADAHDRVVIDGDPPLDVRIAGGVAGDVATCNIVANAAHAVIAARPGLRSMLDVPLVTSRS